MSFYQGLQNTALDLIERYGISVSVKRKTGEYDPVTGLPSNETEQMFYGVGLVEDYTVNQVNDTLIKTGDKKITIAAKDLGTKPVPNDRIIIADESYAIQNVNTVSPAGIDLLYEAHCRK